MLRFRLVISNYTEQYPFRFCLYKKNVFETWLARGCNKKRAANDVNRIRSSVGF